MMPHDLPPWAAVYQRTQRWLRVAMFEEIVYDLRMLPRLDAKLAEDPTAVILGSQTLPSTPESGGRAGYDGHKRKHSSKIHMAADTLGHFCPSSSPPPTNKTGPSGGARRARSAGRRRERAAVVHEPTAIRAKSRCMRP